MELLRLGSTGAAVKRWQHFLLGQGYALGVADGKFGPRTDTATRAFQQARKLNPDGIVGNRTYGAAMLLDFGVVRDLREDVRESAAWPPAPADLAPVMNTRARQRMFGTFDFEHAPTANDPEAVRVDPSWVRSHIESVRVPQLAKSGAQRTAPVRIHAAVARQFLGLWGAWEKAKLLDRVLSWHGSYVPRFVRGSRTALSNHAFGTAFDLNLRWNRLGAVPALVGEEGSLRELVALANEHGFYWGGHYRNRPDGMHFEASAIIEPHIA